MSSRSITHADRDGDRRLARVRRGFWHALAGTGRAEDDPKLSRFYNGFYLQEDRSTTYAERAADCKLARLVRRSAPNSRNRVETLAYQELIFGRPSSTLAYRIDIRCFIVFRGACDLHWDQKFTSVVSTAGAGTGDRAARRNRWGCCIHCSNCCRLYGGSPWQCSRRG